MVVSGENYLFNGAIRLTHTVTLNNDVVQNYLNVQSITTFDTTKKSYTDAKFIVVENSNKIKCLKLPKLKDFDNYTGKQPVLHAHAHGRRQLCHHFVMSRPFRNPHSLIARDGQQISNSKRLELNMSPANDRQNYTFAPFVYGN